VTRYDRAAVEKKVRTSKDRSGAGVRDRNSYKVQADVLKALANESRLLIVDRLQRKECTVGELVALVDLEQSTVSKHLAVLKASGIVEDDRRGNTVVYRLLVPCVVKFLACAADVIRERKTKRG